MSIKIALKKNHNDKLVKNIVLFCDENFKIGGLNKLELSNQSNLINKTSDLYKSKNKNFLLFNINSSQKIILIKVKDIKLTIENERLGAKFYTFIKSNQLNNTCFFEQNIKEFFSKNKSFFNEFTHGLTLKSYIFVKYKSKTNGE